MIAIAPGGQTFVMDINNVGGRIAICSAIPPKRIDIQHLDVDSALVQLPYAVWAERAATLRIARQRRALDHVRYLGDRGMGVHVNHLDALAAHTHVSVHDGSVRTFCLSLLAARASPLRRCVSQEGALRGPKSRCSARNTFNEVPAVRHTLPLRNPFSHALQKYGSSLI